VEFQTEARANRVHQAQSQAVSFGAAGRLTAIEAFTHLFTFTFRDARAIVGYAQYVGLASGLQAQTDVPSPWTEFDRVVYEIRDHLEQQIGIHSLDLPRGELSLQVER